VFGVHQYQDLVFITMALVDGGSLRLWLDARRSTAEILAAFADAGRGLAAAHREGLVHRDFKPGNVLIGNDGRVQVADFGLVHEAPSLDETPTTAVTLGGRDLTQPGTVMGTLPYMAPEQHRGAGVDARVDQYAFCVSLWEALYDARPFVGDTGDELHGAKIRGALQPPAAARDVPQAVHDAIVRGLSPDPDDRWPTMEALVAALAPKRRRALPIAAAAIGIAALALAAWPRPVRQSTDAVVARTSTAGAHVEVQLLLATAEVSRGRADEAARILEDAYEDAIARGLDNAATRAAGQLARTLAVDLDRHADAQAWVRHAEAKADRLEPAQRARLLTDIAWVHERHGRFAEAEALARQALQLRESLGDDRVEIARGHDTLGSILQRRGEYETAVAEHRAALDAFGSTHEIDAAGAHHNLGNALSGLGRYAESEPHLLKALAIRERLRPSDKLGLAGLHNSVAVMYEHWGRFADSLEHHARGLELLEQSVGPGHPDTALVHNNIGSVLYSTGELDRAEVHYAKALAIWEASFGPKHFDVAMVRYNRGSLLADRGERVAAEAEYRQALAIWEELEGPENYAVGAALEGLGNQLLAQERLDEAEAAYRRSIRI
jgi:tetratricopeptide (TPR) repeat protein